MNAIVDALWRWHGSQSTSTCRRRRSRSTPRSSARAPTRRMAGASGRSSPARSALLSRGSARRGRRRPRMPMVGRSRRAARQPRCVAARVTRPPSPAMSARSAAFRAAPKWSCPADGSRAGRIRSCNSVVDGYDRSGLNCRSGDPRLYDATARQVPALVLHGGGNTSVKTKWRDLDGALIDVACVKGSGWDMGVDRAARPAGRPARTAEGAGPGSKTLSTTRTWWRSSAGC